MTGPPVLESGTLTRFVAFVLLALACATTAFYAFRNDRAGTLGAEIWRYVLLAMVAGVGYATVGGAEALGVGGIGGETLTALRRVFQLFCIVLLSLAMRELYYELPHRAAEGAPVSLGTARLLEAGFMAVALAEFGVAILVGLDGPVQVVQSLGSVAFACYGISFAFRVRADTLSSGTVVDVMLLHVIAVLTCLGAVGLLEGGTLVGVPPVVVTTTASVFVVMSATFLITLSIRLKANADRMSA